MLQILQNFARVGLLLDGRPVGDLSWDEAAELGHVLFRRGFDALQPGHTVSLWPVARRTVIFEAGRCDVLYDGGLAASMDVSTARQLGRALIAVARRAEEWAQADEVAADAAVLMRAGMNVGLAHQPDVIAEAAKVAQHDRDLRRFMRNRISERSVVGTPHVIQEKP